MDTGDPVVVSSPRSVTTPLTSTRSPASMETPVAMPQFVYAVGRIDVRAPTIGVERELTQAISGEEAEGHTDRETLQSVLARPENRYLVRQLCWILTIEGLDAYVLQPRDPVDFSALAEALRLEPGADDLDIVVGMLGPPVAAEACGGLDLPLVVFDKIYSFGRDDLIASVPRPSSVADEGKARFRRAVAETVDRFMHLAHNMGATDEHRACNYLAARYPLLYAYSADAYSRNLSLTAIDAFPSRLSANRRVVDVVLTFRDRKTDVAEKQFMRVDVSEEFPYLVTKLTPYFDR